jgi:hypothetical protein
LIEEGSYPDVDQLVLEAVPGVGLTIRGNSYPRIGPIRASNCATEHMIEEGSRIRAGKEE